MPVLLFALSVFFSFRFLLYCTTNLLTTGVRISVAHNVLVRMALDFSYLFLS
jgi:hypothetical protein